MSAGDGPEPAQVYELTIVGEIGPVLRNALRPQVAEPARVFTILRTVRLPGRDLVDLVRLLDARGLDIQDIFETAPARRPPFPLAGAAPNTGM